uniref:Plexin-B1 n=1 Tax=Pogona vitticeps TaxID=103695 RepID=A0ABM5FJ05_9SAUR
MSMMPLGALLLSALCLLGTVIPYGRGHASFSCNTTKFLHLVMDPNTGTLYVGATNFLFQLTSDLVMEEEVSTGPFYDSKDCLPPVTTENCPPAQKTDNYNKLLLVNSLENELIVCGSVWQGICEKRQLGVLNHILFQPQTPGDTQYVAANDPNISTVGLVGYSKDNVPLLFVGRGYTSRGVGGSIPPITTRNLRAHPGEPPGPDSHSIFSYEETAKLAVGRLSEYNHHFIQSFTHGSSVYFLFYRRDLKSHSREYKTYISKICLDDSHYYSYVELPLVCRSKDKTYSLVQAAYVAQPGGEGDVATAQGDMLFAAFSTLQASSGKPSEESALCIYTMDEVDRLTTQTRDLCYTKDGKTEEGIEVAYIEYDVNSICVQLSADTLDAYPCGSDHTPSPMASRLPLEVTPVLEMPDAHLTAVAVSIEDGHTVIFLGTSKGQLHKAYLGAMGEAHLYASQVIEPNSAMSGDLLFDQQKKHLYVMTQSTVSKIPIFECSKYSDCESCLALRDPYCGWCVLQGKCSRRSECSRFDVSEQWLWGFNVTQQCPSVQSLSPASISREEQKNIFLTLSDLPPLPDREYYSCFFEDYESPAVRMGSGIMCPSPNPSHALVLKAGTDHITIQLVVRFHDIFIASTAFSFYDCKAVAFLRRSAPCQGCVSSHWGCNWCVQQHLCTHKAACEEGTMIYNERTQIPNFSPFPSSATPNAATSPSSSSSSTGATEATVISVTPLPPSTPSPTTVPVIPATSPPVTLAVTTAQPETLGPTHVASSNTVVAVTSPEATADSLTLAPTEVPTTASPTSEPTSGHPPETPGHTTCPTSELTTGLDDWSTVSPSTATQSTEWPFVESLTPSPDIENSTTASPLPEATPSPVPTFLTPNQTGNASTSSLDLLSEDLETELPTSETPRPTGPSDWPLPEDSTESKDSEEWLGPLLPENDTSSLSASILLSGDGDSSESDISDFPRILNPGLDYQYDAPGFLDLNEEFTWGADACPCVRGIQGSSLLPVNVQRKITLIGRNFHLYEDQLWDYECALVLEGKTLVVEAYIEQDETNPTLSYITCQLHQYSYSAPQPEFSAEIFVQRKQRLRVDSIENLNVTIYNCSVGHLDCSRCQTADAKYNCVWCGGEQPSCLFRDSCKEEVADLCPAPRIHSVYPLTGLVEGGTRITITGSNLGQKHEDIAETVTVAGIPCEVDPVAYQISSSIECTTGGSGTERSGHVVVGVLGGGQGVFGHVFTYQNPELSFLSPSQGPKAGGTALTLKGSKLLTGNPSKISVLVGNFPCYIHSEVQEDLLQCLTSPSDASMELPVTIKYGNQERRLENPLFKYTLDPNITYAEPSKSFHSGGREIRVRGHNLDVVKQPRIRVTVSPVERRRRGLGRWRRIIPETECPKNALCSVQQFEEPCEVNSSSLILCKTPAIQQLPHSIQVKVEFVLDNLVFDFSSFHPTGFSYEVDPVLKPLNTEDQSKPYRHKPGSVISVEGENLDLAIYKEEVKAMIGVGICAVKTLTKNHLYCEPPTEQPAPQHRAKREGTDSLPEFTVQMGNMNFSLGRVQYDTESQLNFPLEAQIGLGVGASFVALIVLIIVFIYRRKSKQALRDYKKVQIQLENLETSVRDRCKKEFTDLMTEMMDLTSDLVGTGIPFLDYKTYAERIFFPGHRESPLQRDLDVPESRRQTVEQGLVQLSNLLNSKLFLTKFIHTLEIQRTFSPRDRAYVASLLTVALHGKLEYFTDILKTLLNDLVEQYVAKNPKLMLRRTETVVEKLLTNWMSICLYAFVRDSVGEPLYMLFRGIKHQVDKGPVDWVTGKAKYTLNDNRLLREDLEYRTLTLTAVAQTGSTVGGPEGAQGVLAKALDCDTITQVKEKILDQIYKGTPYCHRPDPDALDLEWRSGLAGHLILSDEDVTSVVQGNWKRLNTLQHYKVPDGATVALVPRMTKHLPRENQDYIPGEKTPMLEDADEGGMKLWHLVKPTEEPELPKHRRGSLRERERAKAIPEIYLTRLLSMKGTLQKFVDDLFQVILSTNRPVPLAVKYFFDLLDEQALNHGITDLETIHIWKTNSLPLRFWINIIKNPQFVFDVQTSDNVDAVLLVIAQTFMDSCTLADHKLGRDSPINKLLYARDIPRYKQMVERYYADIRQTISASDQEMNSALAELSRNYSGELNSLVALHELYKYINKYYDQIITALEEDPTAQKMQLGYRLQQIAAAVENKVTDL